MANVQCAQMASQRMINGLNRLESPQPCVDLYREHAVRTGVMADLPGREPGLDLDVVFGIKAFNAVEGGLADRILSSWARGARLCGTGSSRLAAYSVWRTAVSAASMIR